MLLEKFPEMYTLLCGPKLKVRSIFKMIWGYRLFNKTKNTTYSTFQNKNAKTIKYGSLLFRSDISPIFHSAE